MISTSETAINFYRGVDTENKNIMTLDDLDNEVWADSDYWEMVVAEQISWLNTQI